jgi:hypothetical protein
MSGEGRITKVTLRVGHRCPTCGELPPDFRGSFDRRVEQQWIVPARSKHWEGPKPEGWAEAVEKFPQLRFRDESPEGLYPAVIVPMSLIGRIIRITPVEEKT